MQLCGYAVMRFAYLGITSSSRMSQIYKELVTSSVTYNTYYISYSYRIPRTPYLVPRTFSSPYNRNSPDKRPVSIMQLNKIMIRIHRQILCPTPAIPGDRIPFSRLPYQLSPPVINCDVCFRVEFNIFYFPHIINSITIWRKGLRDLRKCILVCESGIYPHIDFYLIPNTGPDTLIA